MWQSQRLPPFDLRVSANKGVVGLPDFYLSGPATAAAPISVVIRPFALTSDRLRRCAVQLITKCREVSTPYGRYLP